jgi:hypothetical protein
MPIALNWYDIRWNSSLKQAILHQHTFNIVLVDYYGAFCGEAGLVEMMIPIEYGASFMEHKSERTLSSEFPLIRF